MGESLIKWIFQPRSINTGLEKIRFTNIFLPERRVAGGCVSNSEVINHGGSCGKASLDSDGASQLRSELQFLSQPVARIVSDDNNRIQFLRSEWNNKVLVYVSWTFMSPPLQKEARLFSSFQFFVPKYTLKERENWWPEHIKFKHPFQPFIRDILKFQSGTSSWASICVRFPHVWIGKSAIIVGHLGKIHLLRLRISGWGRGWVEEGVGESLWVVHLGFVKSHIYFGSSRFVMLVITTLGL